MIRTFPFTDTLPFTEIFLIMTLDLDDPDIEIGDEFSLSLHTIFDKE